MPVSSVRHFYGDKMSLYSSIKTKLESWEQEGALSAEEYRLEESLSLSRLTTFKTGGEALVFFPKTEKAVVLAVSFFREKQIPFFVLGNGSNVIAKDEGYPGVILSFSLMKEVTVSGNRITAQAGAPITGLAALAQKHSLSGMEFFYGIPGSVGGAVFMNAGAYGGECKDIVKEVTFLSAAGEICTRSVDWLQMGYRTSVFENNGAVILSATFELTSGDGEAIRATMEELMARRVQKQPLDYPSAGSTFKRCEGRFTAQMIDEAGLKGYRIGGAQVSEKHAGFVINAGGATAHDLLALIAHIQKVILEKEGIAIQREVRIIE